MSYEDVVDVFLAPQEMIPNVTFYCPMDIEQFCTSHYIYFSTQWLPICDYLYVITECWNILPICSFELVVKSHKLHKIFDMCSHLYLYESWLPFWKLSLAWPHAGIKLICLNRVTIISMEYNNPCFLIGDNTVTEKPFH